MAERGILPDPARRLLEARNNPSAFDDALNKVGQAADRADALMGDSPTTPLVAGEIQRARVPEVEKRLNNIRIESFNRPSDRHTADDRVIELTNGGAVLDGASEEAKGSGSIAADLSKEVVEPLVRLPRVLDPAEGQKRIIAAVEQADAKVKGTTIVLTPDDRVIIPQTQQEKHMEELDKMGSTITLGEIFHHEGKDYLVIAWAGDTPGYLIRNGVAYEMTPKYDGIQDIRHAPEVGSGIYNYIGKRDSPVRVSSRIEEVMVGDIVVIASDGVIGKRRLSPQRVAEIASQYPEGASEKMVDEAWAMGIPETRDDATALTIRVEASTNTNSEILKPPVPVRAQEAGVFNNRPDIVRSISNIWGQLAKDRASYSDEEFLRVVRNTVDALIDRRAVISPNSGEMTYVGLIKELGVPHIYGQDVINAFVNRLAHYMAEGIRVGDPELNPDRLTAQDLVWLQANARFFASTGMREQGEPTPQDLYRGYFQREARVIGVEGNEISNNPEVWPKGERVVDIGRRLDGHKGNYRTLRDQLDRDRLGYSDREGPYQEGNEGAADWRDIVRGPIVSRIIDERPDFEEGLGEILLRRISELPPEGRDVFWWCLSSRIGNVLGRTEPMWATRGQQYRGTLGNPDGLHAADWPWLVQAGRFIEAHADITGGLHTQNGDRVRLGADIGERPMIIDNQPSEEEFREEYILARDKARRSVSATLGILRRVPNQDPSARIGDSFITDHTGIDRNLENRLSTSAAILGEHISRDDMPLSFRQLARELIYGQYTPEMLQAENLGRIFTPDVLIAVQDEMFRTARLDHGRSMESNLEALIMPGGHSIVTVLGGVLPEYRQWSEQIVNSPQFKNWLASNPPDINRNNSYPSHSEFQSWLATQSQNLSSETNLFIPDQSSLRETEIVQAQERLGAIMGMIERGDYIDEFDTDSLINRAAQLWQAGSLRADVVKLREGVVEAIQRNPQAQGRVLSFIAGDLNNLCLVDEKPLNLVRSVSFAGAFLDFNQLFPELRGTFHAINEIAEGRRDVSEFPKFYIMSQALRDVAWRLDREAGRVVVSRDIPILEDPEDENRMSILTASSRISSVDYGILKPAERPTDAASYYQGLLRLGESVDLVTGRIAQNEDCRKAAAQEVFNQLDAGIERAGETGDFSRVDSIARIARAFEIDRVLPELQEMVETVLEEAGEIEVGDSGLPNMENVLLSISDAELRNIHPDSNPVTAASYYQSVLLLGRSAEQITLQISRNPETARAAAQEVFNQLDAGIERAGETGDFSRVERIGRVARNFRLDQVLPQLRQMTDAVLAPEVEE